MKETASPSGDKILLHINYFEQGQSIERAFALTREVGADGLELRAKSTDPAKDGQAYLDEIARAMDRYPLDLLSFGSPGVNVLLADSGERARELQTMAAFYTEANRRFPLGVLNLMGGKLSNPDAALSPIAYEHHGSVLATEEQWSMAVEGLKVIGSMAEAEGLTFAFETHGHLLHDTVEATCRLVRDIGSPNIGVLWDHLNLMLFPTSPSLSDVVAEVGEAMYYVHLKNALVPPRQFLSISDLESGVINIREQVRLLKASGYRGPWCIESPRPGDREDYAVKDFAYLRRLLDAVRQE